MTFYSHEGLDALIMVNQNSEYRRDKYYYYTLYTIESFRFWDEHDYEYEIFWRENMTAVVSLLRVFCDRKRVKESPIKITAQIFQVKNSTMKLSGLNILLLKYAKKTLS